MTTKPAQDLLVDVSKRQIDLEQELRIFLGSAEMVEKIPEGWVHLCSAREVVLALMLADVVELSLTDQLKNPEVFGGGSQVVAFLKAAGGAGSKVRDPRDGIRFRDGGESDDPSPRSLPTDCLGRSIDWEQELRIWLDDDVTNRQAWDGWLHFRTVRETAMALMLGYVVELSLDSDLNGDDVYGQGFQVVDFLDNQEGIAGVSLWPRDGITVHSANPESRDHMRRALETLPRRHPYLRVMDDDGQTTSKPKYYVERGTEAER